jgi:hypothetical protein
MVVPTPAAVPPPAPAAVPPAWELVPAELVPPPPAESDTKDCPFCDETIKANAKKCKHCGEILDVVLRAADEKRRKNKNNNQQQVVIQQDNRRRRRERGRVRLTFPYHAVHIVLTIFTFGFWLIIWLIHWAIWESSGPYWDYEYDD